MSQLTRSGRSFGRHDQLNDDSTDANSDHGNQETNVSGLGTAEPVQHLPSDESSNGGGNQQSSSTNFNVNEPSSNLNVLKDGHGTTAMMNRRPGVEAGHGTTAMSNGMFPLNGESANFQP